jgi:hypothetical protein
MKIDPDLLAALRANATSNDQHLRQLIRWHVGEPALAELAVQEIIRQFRESNPAPAAKPQLLFFGPERPRGPR